MKMNKINEAIYFVKLILFPFSSIHKIEEKRCEITNYHLTYRVVRSMLYRLCTSTDIILIDKLSCYASQWFDDYGNAKGSHDNLDLACFK